MALKYKVLAFSYGVGSHTDSGSGSTLTSGLTNDGRVKGKGKGFADASLATNGFWMEKTGEWETAENPSGMWAGSKRRIALTLMCRPDRCGYRSRIHTTSFARPTSRPCAARPSPAVSFTLRLGGFFVLRDTANQDFGSRSLPLAHHPRSHSRALKSIMHRLGLSPSHDIRARYAATGMGHFSR